MDRLNPPNELQLTHGNVSENWRIFKRAFNIYTIASGLDEKSAKIQSSTLLHIIGHEAIELLNTFKWDACDKNCDSKNDFHSVSCMLGKFDSYFSPKKNVTIERHIFFTRNQSEGEQFDVFLTDLKLKAKTCEFENLKDSLIKDKIVSGIRDDQVRSRLLRENELTLKRAEEICRAAELSELQLKLIKSDEDSICSVNASNTKHDQPQFKNSSMSCTYCGLRHQPRRCPAYGKLCNNCGRKNHFKSVCRSSTAHVKNVTTEKNENETNEFFVANVANESESVENSKEWTSAINIQGRQITFTLDTGAQVNIIPYNLFRRLKKTYLQTSQAHLTSYCGQKLNVVGKAQLKCRTQKCERVLEFQVIDARAKPILGLNGCESLNLVQRIDIVENDEILSSFSDVFEGLGCMKDSYKIKIDPTVPPVIHPSRKVPAALRNSLLKELERMEREKVIEKVDYPTDWVNSLVIVEKNNGDLRLCLDPRDLNKAIKREHYPLPTIEEIVSRQSGNEIFSILDANSAFWQIQLDPESSALTTFNTPFGRYKFLRLPFGLNSSAEVFAKRFHQAFESVPGVETYMDEMLISGRDIEEHDERLRRVLEAAREKGIKLKPSKCHLRVREVTFVGHVISKAGLKADSSKVDAILQMPEPSNRKELERFMGMINYLGKFIPNLSAVTSPLRDLLKKENDWQWSHEHCSAVKDLKRLITQAPVLGFFNVDQPVVLSVDASLQGLGAVLIQNNKPIAYASRSLSDCETRYAQIEKELLAVVFAVEHFHYYVYGRSVTVETDHKPLLSIIKKP